VEFQIANIQGLLAQAREKAARDTKTKAAERATFKKQAVALALARRQRLELAAAILSRYIPRDPTNPHLRYRVALALHEAGLRPAAREQAREAVKLDEQVRAPRKLTDRQRQQLARWLLEGSSR
jgi:hypothetical protein